MAKKFQKNEVLAIIPARAGSKRIPNKNTRNFLGKPLLAYSIEHALKSPLVNRVMVDTDSNLIARLGKKYGAEAPFLRPKSLAKDNSRIKDSLVYLVKRLQREENYYPTHIILLQPTSPLREQGDIEACWKTMRSARATTVVTVSQTHPKLYHLSPQAGLLLVNGSEKDTNNAQSLRPAYMLNGCVYIIETQALLKEKLVFTKKTRAVILPSWRAVDIDTPEEWAEAELIFKNYQALKRGVNRFSQHGKK